MSGFIDIQHDEWVDAAPDVVRAHYVDLQHRIDARVHPDERLRLLEPGPAGPRFERIARVGWRMQRDLFERRLKPDGSIVDTVVAGANWGRSVSARFWRRNDDGRPGTLVELTVTQPLPLIGRLLSRWTCRRIERELRMIAVEDKLDVERGYKVDRGLRAA